MFQPAPKRLGLASHKPNPAPRTRRIDRQTDGWTNGRMNRFPLCSTGLHPLRVHCPAYLKGWLIKMSEQGKGTADHILPLGDRFPFISFSSSYSSFSFHIFFPSRSLSVLVFLFLSLFYFLFKFLFPSFAQWFRMLTKQDKDIPLLHESRFTSEGASEGASEWVSEPSEQYGAKE